MKLSLMWMTRKRSHELIYSVCSFLHKATDNSNIEYIFVTDPDDDETVDALEKIVPMAHAHHAELIHITAKENYGYASLEEYQNAAAKVFSGECLICINDDHVCIQDGWDISFRKTLSERQGSPAWISISPLNELWKGYPTIVGINRAWYERTKRFSGTRATDIYLMDLGNAAKIKPIIPTIETLHLQRGRKTMEYNKNGMVHTIYGLPAEETHRGNKGSNPIPPAVYYKYDNGEIWPETDYELGKKIFAEDLDKLLGNT
tara:strand:- start:576 stop:1355 length:780 start_codon:yes stop_codon:yes gene_type:complete